MGNLKFVAIEEYMNDKVVKSYFINEKPVDEKVYDALRSDEFDKLYKNVKIKNNKNNVMEEFLTSQDDGVTIHITSEDSFLEAVFALVDELKGDNISTDEATSRLVNLIESVIINQQIISTEETLKYIKSDFIDYVNKSLKRMRKGRLF